jgi:hypothetical protein
MADLNLHGHLSRRQSQSRSFRRIQTNDEAYVGKREAGSEYGFWESADQVANEWDESLRPAKGIDTGRKYRCGSAVQEADHYTLLPGPR